jgi:Glu-tRNA(Gln) amidotransferase subunit E-like FAD-binding protein
MTLSPDDLQTIKDLFEGLKADITSKVESQLKSEFMKQGFALERRLRAETLKVTSELRKQIKDLKESTSKTIKETFEMVYEDHPTKQEVEEHLEDLRDETDKRFAKHDKRLDELEQAQHTA